MSIGRHDQGKGWAAFRLIGLPLEGSRLKCGGPLPPPGPPPSLPCLPPLRGATPAKGERTARAPVTLAVMTTATSRHPAPRGGQACLPYRLNPNPTTAAHWKHSRSGTRGGRWEPKTTSPLGLGPSREGPQRSTATAQGLRGVLTRRRASSTEAGRPEPAAREGAGRPEPAAREGAGRPGSGWMQHLYLPRTTHNPLAARRVWGPGQNGKSGPVGRAHRSLV